MVWNFFTVSLLVSIVVTVSSFTVDKRGLATLGFEGWLLRGDYAGRPPERSVGMATDFSVELALNSISTVTL